MTARRAASGPATTSRSRIPVECPVRRSEATLAPRRSAREWLRSDQRGEWEKRRGSRAIRGRFQRLPEPHRAYPNRPKTCRVFLTNASEEFTHIACRGGSLVFAGADLDIRHL